MKPYERQRQQENKRSGIIGIAAALLGHAGVLVISAFTGLSYLDPPPPETSFVIDFEEEIETPKPVETLVGRQPQAEEIDRTKEVDLVQKSEAPTVIKKPNTTPATKPDPHGDVDVPTPKYKEEPKLDPRASFPGMSEKESTSTTPHSASEASEGFKAGQPDGNTPSGKTQGSANAHLKGRTLMVSLPKPSYSAQKEGTVVVRIKVDQYGIVVEAVPGVEGTTVTDKDLWNAARLAAMKAVFNQAADAPAVQMGTITYKFKLQ